MLVKSEIPAKNHTDYYVMRLAILPLTYRNREKKLEAVSDAAQLAGAISDDATHTVAGVYRLIERTE